MNKIRRRLVDLVDSALKKIYKNYPEQTLILNQALLQQWIDFLHSLISPKKSQKPQPVLSLHQISVPQPQKNEFTYLISTQQNSLTLYDKHNQSNTFHVQRVRRCCSATFISSNEVLLVGGCRKTNQNKKSNQILLWHISDTKVIKVGQLLEGISSHSAVHTDQGLYIIGGFKDGSVPSRRCSLYQNGQTKQIASLNEASAAHSCIRWNNCIYKVGGVGDCFGTFDLSPYIEKYDPACDEWEIINPQLQPSLQVFVPLAHSLLYISNKNQLVILGGYDFEQDASDTLCIMEYIAGNKYVITNVGVANGMIKGGFMHSNTVSQGYALQQVWKNSQSSTNYVIEINKNIKYVS